MGICGFRAREEAVVPQNYTINLEDKIVINEKKDEKVQNTSTDNIVDKKNLKTANNNNNSIKNEEQKNNDNDKNNEYDKNNELINNFKKVANDLNKINTNKTPKSVKFNVLNDLNGSNNNLIKINDNNKNSNFINNSSMNIININNKEKTIEKEMKPDSILQFETEENAKESMKEKIKEKIEEKTKDKEEENKKERYKRKKKTHKTISINLKNHSQIPDDLNNNAQSTPKNEKSFKRRHKKSTTLVEKSRLGHNLFKEELKLCVSNQTLIEEQTGDPSLRYKILNKLGDGSYGTVYSAINILTGLKIAMKKIEKIKNMKLMICK